MHAAVRAFLRTALQQENNISQASLNARAFGNYRPVIRDEGRECGYQEERFYASRLFTSNERAIIVQIRQRSASGEEKNLSGLSYALRARVVALVIIFLPTVTLTTCDEQAGEIGKAVLAVFRPSTPQRAQGRVSRLVFSSAILSRRTTVSSAHK